MAIQGVMASMRARHPFRLALVCALLALAGGSPSASGGYAEVASAAAVVGVPARYCATSLAVVAAGALAPIALTLAPPARSVSSRAIAPLYLSHCALLL
jgi:hypothetical protein